MVLAMACKAGSGTVEDVASRLAGSPNAADSLVTDFVADCLANDSWAGGGIKSPEHFVCWQFGLTTAAPRPS